MVYGFVLVAALLALPSSTAAQVATIVPEDDEPASNPDDVLGRAEDAQRRFERIRLRRMPARFGGGRGPCDEYVGRFCTTYDEGEWVPRPEDEELTEARGRLLQELDSLQELVPGQPWILGQRVWYRAESGDWGGALGVARRCGAVESWWCAALRGLALHGLGRDGASLTAFEEALAVMDSSAARDWRVPERAVDGRARDLLEDAEEAGPGVLDRTLSALWTLADPLFLVEGNDRLAAHYARWTVSEIKRDARNPYGLGWADDLEELTIRHGWELGWERVRSSLPATRDAAVGHKHPEGRDYMPTGRVLEDPAASRLEDLTPARRSPRSLYAPRYAPVLLPMDGQLAVFPRGGRMALVASAFLPDDTTFHSEHDHERPWMEVGDQEGMSDRIGLFAVPVGPGATGAQTDRGGARSEGARARAGGPDDAFVWETRREGSAEGALLLELPVDAYVISVESWSPERRRAGRLRAGLRRERAPEDIPVLSDLLLLDSGSVAPSTLEDALPLALPRARIGPHAPLAIVWELTGLGFREESLEYSVSVERTDRNVLRRLGDFLGLTERPRPLQLAWQEPGPDAPERHFRHLALDLPALDEGAYEITLTLRTEGRSDVVATQGFEVIDEG